MKNLKTLTLAIALVIISNGCFAQIDKQTNTKQVFIFVEQMPVFPGGEKAMEQFLSQNIKYPDSARINKTSGKVIIQFIVNQDSSISDIKIIRDIGSGCGDEALRVVKRMPKWVPGKQNGHDVNVQMMLPVSFKLN